MPTLADICLVPQLANARRVKLDLAPYPTLLRIEAACAALPAFADAAPAQATGRRKVGSDSSFGTTPPRNRDSSTQVESDPTYDPVFPVWDVPEVPVSGSADCFPVRHIYCVGRNYAEHAKEMGGDATKEPPFFFTKPADAVVPVVPPAVGRVPYPLATKNYHHEIELVVAIGARGVESRARRTRSRSSGATPSGST